MQPRQKKYNAQPDQSINLINKKYYFANIKPSFKKVPSTGYFATILHNGSQAQQKKSDVGPEDGMLVFGKNDPGAKKVALNYIKSWKWIKSDNPKTGFIHNVVSQRRNRDREQEEQQSYRNWWIFGSVLLPFFFGEAVEKTDPRAISKMFTSMLLMEKWQQQWARWNLLKSCTKED